MCMVRQRSGSLAYLVLADSVVVLDAGPEPAVILDAAEMRPGHQAEASSIRAAPVAGSVVKPAERLVAAATRLLPKAQRDWGRAMLAELSALEARAERWRFTAGCLRVVCTRPAVWRRIGYPALTAAGLALTVLWSRQFAYAPLRWASVAVVAALVAIGWLGRIRGPFGPVRSDGPARSVRLTGFAVVTLWTVALLTTMGIKDPIGTGTGAPILGAVAAAYLAAFLVLTAHSTAGRVLWAALAGTGQRLIAVGGAGMVGALLLVSTVITLSAYAPARLIPDLASHALSPAEDLAQSRSEIQDPYVGLLVVGGVLALLPVLAATWSSLTTLTNSRLREH